MKEVKEEVNLKRIIRKRENGINWIGFIYIKGIGV